MPRPRYFKGRLIKINKKEKGLNTKGLTRDGNADVARKYYDIIIFIVDIKDHWW